MWPAIRTAYGWVHRAARLLENEEEAPGGEVRRRMEDLLAEMRDGQAAAGTLRPAVAHFLKVSASYWPGLFHCYDVPGLPRTNNWSYPARADGSWLGQDSVEWCRRSYSAGLR